MIYHANKKALLGLMDHRADKINDQDGLTSLNFVVQIMVIKIGTYPSKTDRIIHSAETKAEGYILIELIFN